MGHGGQGQTPEEAAALKAKRAEIIARIATDRIAIALEDAKSRFTLGGEDGGDKKKSGGGKSKKGNKKATEDDFFGAGKDGGDSSGLPGGQGGFDKSQSQEKCADYRKQGEFGAKKFIKP